MTARHIADALDRRTHSKCPRKPEGYKFRAHISGRFGSCGFGFDTFADALKFARDGWTRAVKDSKARRFVGDEHAMSEFRAELEGPYGAFDARAVEHLVRNRAAD